MLKGPGHPGNQYADPTEPYFWSPDNRTALRDWIFANVSDAITFRLIPPGSLPMLGAVDNIMALQRTPVDVQLPEAIGGDAPLDYTVNGLPSGLQFNPATRRITGTAPDATGVHQLTYRVEDDDGDTASQALTLTIATLVTADTITATGVSARALITVGEHANWYSRHAGQTVGTAEGDLSLDTYITLSRVQFFNNFNRLRLNHSGAGTFSAWYAEGGAGHGKSVYFAFGDSLIDLDIDERHASSGGTYLNLNLPAEAAAPARGVSVGDRVNLVIADTGTGSRS